MIIPNTYFLYINIFVALLFVSFAFISYNKGFLYEIFSLFFTIGSFVISWMFAPDLADNYPLFSLAQYDETLAKLFESLNIDHLVNTVIYFLIIFFVVRILYWAISFILKAFNHIPLLGPINKLLGMFVGLIHACLITVLMSLVLSLPLFLNSKEVKDNTVFKYVDDATTYVLTYLGENIDLNDLQNINFDKLTDFDIESLKELTSNE